MTNATNAVTPANATMHHWRLEVSTQVRENYGAHDWDGAGACPQYWKFKGGRDLIVAAWASEPTPSEVRARAEMVAEEDSDYYQEHVIGWRLLAPGSMTAREEREAEDAWHNPAARAKRQAEREAVLYRLWLEEQLDLLEHALHRERLRWEGKR